MNFYNYKWENPLLSNSVATSNYQVTGSFYSEVFLQAIIDYAYP